MKVTHLRVDGTARIAVCESRSPPGINQKNPAISQMVAGFFTFQKVVIPEAVIGNPGAGLILLCFAVVYIFL
jgi:hypothetical protein